MLADDATADGGRQIAPDSVYSWGGRQIAESAPIVQKNCPEKVFCIQNHCCDGLGIAVVLGGRGRGKAVLQDDRTDVRKRWSRGPVCVGKHQRRTQ